MAEEAPEEAQTYLMWEEAKRSFWKGTNRITFKDVAGQAAAKQEVQEIVDFLKQPQNIRNWVEKFLKVLY